MTREAGRGEVSRGQRPTREASFVAAGWIILVARSAENYRVSGPCLIGNFQTTIPLLSCEGKQEA